MTKFELILKSLDESVQVNTEQWQASSGKKQPGAQHKGLWIFTKNKNTELKPEDEGITYFYAKGSILYTDAKKQAIKWAKEKGYGTIYVGP